jgi:hypothetical protein
MSTAEASGSWAAQAALRAAAHERALEVVRELALLRRGGPSWIPGRDPAEAVEAAMARV